MKRKYVSPEFDLVRFEMESLMNDLNYSDPHIPVEGGDVGEND